MTKRELLDYEMYASYWWVSQIGPKSLQTWTAAYFAWKVNRKYAAMVRGQKRAHAIRKLQEMQRSVGDLSNVKPNYYQSERSG